VRLPPHYLNTPPRSPLRKTGPDSHSRRIQREGPTARGARGRRGELLAFKGASPRRRPRRGGAIWAVSAPAPAQGLGALGLEAVLLANAALHHDPGVRQLLDPDGR